MIQVGKKDSRAAVMKLGGLCACACVCLRVCVCMCACVCVCVWRAEHEEIVERKVGPKDFSETGEGCTPTLHADQTGQS